MCSLNPLMCVLLVWRRRGGSERRRGNANVVKINGGVTIVDFGGFYEWLVLLIGRVPEYIRNVAIFGMNSMCRPTERATMDEATIA